MHVTRYGCGKGEREKGMALLEYVLGVAGIIAISYGVFETLGENFDKFNSELATWLNNRAKAINSTK